MNPFEEHVRGTIIGDVTFPYQFWAWREYGWTLRYYECIARGSFRNDDEAEAWVKEHYPDDYANGIEMRCFDQG